jgi:S-adenosylmethionine uptake transporter
MDASALAPFQYCDFIVAAFLSYLVFSEIPTKATCCGFAIIAPCALFLTYIESKKQTK